jgi:hypothetical protein
VRGYGQYRSVARALDVIGDTSILRRVLPDSAPSLAPASRS